MDKTENLVIRLRQLLRHRGRRADEANDLIQEAFVRLQAYCQGRPPGAAIARPEAFLVRTTLNLMVDLKRKRRTLPPIESGVESLALADPAPMPDEVLQGEQRLERMNRGLERLSPRVREVLLMHRLEGYSYRQIAEELHLSVKTVEHHIAKGSLFLFNWMAQEDAS